MGKVDGMVVSRPTMLARVFAAALGLALAGAGVVGLLPTFRARASTPRAPAAADSWVVPSIDWAPPPASCGPLTVGGGWQLPTGERVGTCAPGSIATLVRRATPGARALPASGAEANPPADVAAALPPPLAALVPLAPPPDVVSPPLPPVPAEELPPGAPDPAPTADVPEDTPCIDRGRSDPRGAPPRELPAPDDRTLDPSLTECAND
jgi:hypothetical protein